MFSEQAMEELIRTIEEMRLQNGIVLLSVDGKCASGKTTLALALAERIPCNIFHMDDFFLRPQQRTPERYAEPGGNVDRERFEEEVLRPLRAGRPFSYAPFDCRTMALSLPVSVTPAQVNIIEGSYSQHPSLCPYYDLKIFTEASLETRLQRLRERQSENIDRFLQQWIPLEDAYCDAFSVKENADFCIET